MKKNALPKWVSVAFIGGLALLIACGPASQSNTTGGSTSTGGGATTGQTGGTGGTTTGQTGGSTEPMTTSVNGLPLDSDAKYGGVLKVFHTSEGPSFSPWEEAVGWPFTAGHPMSNNILQQRTWGADQDAVELKYLEIHPDLAKSWEMSPDGLQFTFKFHDGVKWSDGVPFTCADAKWTLDTIKSGEDMLRSPRALHFATVKEITCPDDLTMVIAHTRPKPAFIDTVGMGFHMVRPKHIYEGNGKLLRERALQAGTGPFVLGQYLPGEKITFTRKADYWNKPFPYLDGIESQLLTATSADAAVRTGRLDVRGGMSGGTADSMSRECTVCTFFSRQTNPGMYFMMVNHTQSPWNTPEIKDAISLGMDRARIGAVGFQGWVLAPEAGPFYPKSYWAMPEELLKTIPGYNFTDVAGNQAKARELLAKAGYQPGELKLRLDSWAGANYTSVTIIMEEDLEKAGFDVEVVFSQESLHYEMAYSGDFKVILTHQTLGSLDPDVVFSEHFRHDSQRNYGKYNNPQVERMMDEVSATTDPELRRQKAWQTAEVLMREHAKFMVAQGTTMSVINNRVRGWMPTYAFSPTNRFERTWLTS